MSEFNLEQVAAQEIDNHRMRDIVRGTIGLLGVDVLFYGFLISRELPTTIGGIAVAIGSGVAVAQAVSPFRRTSNEQYPWDPASKNFTDQQYQQKRNSLGEYKATD